MSGQRTTSFSFLLNDKRGVIGKALSTVPQQFREAAFMGGQLRRYLYFFLLIRTNDMHVAIVYAVLTELPAVFVLYDSSFWSGTFLIFIFAVSVWNGGGFYIEVFGRKYVFAVHNLFVTLIFLSPFKSQDLNANWKLYGRNWQKQPRALGGQVLRVSD